MSFASEEYVQDHIDRMGNPERWPCPAKNWYVLRRFLLDGTPNDSCSERDYSNISGLNRHIKRKHIDEGIPQQKREYLSSSFWSPIIERSP